MLWHSRAGVLSRGAVVHQMDYNVLAPRWAVGLGCLHLLSSCQALACAQHPPVPPAACVNVMLLLLCRAAAMQPVSPQPWLLPAHPLQLSSVSLVAFFSQNTPFKDLGAQDLPMRPLCSCVGLLSLHHGQELPLVLGTMFAPGVPVLTGMGTWECQGSPPRGDLDVPHTVAMNPPVGTPVSSHLQKGGQKGRCCLLLAHRELCLPLLAPPWQ